MLFRSDLDALEVLVGESFKTWFNTILSMSMDDQICNTIEAIIQKAKVSPPSVQI